MEQMRELSLRDPMTDLTEQEKEQLWKLRKHLIVIPDILPRLLDAVKWGSRDEVSQVCGHFYCGKF